MQKVGIILFILVSWSSAFATLFLPLEINKQIEEANSAAEVELVKSQVVRSPQGKIVTEYFFNVSEATNLSADDLENGKLKLVIPGGSLDGMSVFIDGAPSFSRAQKSFLLLKKINGKIYLSNFSLGKYNLLERDGKTYYVSEVFPNHPSIGMIEKKQMQTLMRERWKTSNTPSVGPHEKVVEFKKETIKRVPAQEVAPRKENAEGISLAIIWKIAGLVFFLFLLVGILKKKKNV